MKIIETDQKFPIKSWCPDLEPSALQQAINATTLPCVCKPIALMPDCHPGYGVPIGAVVVTKDAVIPVAAGVDIGCGMRVSEFKLPFSIVENKIIREQWIAEVKETIPLGFKHHHTPQETDFNPIEEYFPPYLVQDIPYQIGTLGGGNHFIELQKDKSDNVWLMIHSGSRGIGYQTANYYIKIAEDLCKSFSSPVFFKEGNLAFLPKGHKEFDRYIIAQSYMLDFAYLNRELMMKAAIDCLSKVLCMTIPVKKTIDVHHNYVETGRSIINGSSALFIHRKGATAARREEYGIIPGSMGTNSYIVEGLSSEDSYESCSHGAGRVMGRGEYTKTHTEKQCNVEMGDIVFSGWSKGRKGQIDLSEAPSAYKDIDEVMENQKDLVRIMVELTPIASVKG